MRTEDAYGKYVPPFLLKEERVEKMSYVPQSLNEICGQGVHKIPPQKRYAMCAELKQLYIPNGNTCRTYDVIYSAICGGILMKADKRVAQRAYMNRSATAATHACGHSNGISSSILGESGVGKTSSISASISAVSEGAIETERGVIIPCVLLETPHDCSVKTLLRNFISVTDSMLGGEHMKEASSPRVSTGELMHMVGRIASTSVACIVIDEVQLLRLKHGDSLMRFLLSLINTTGVSIVFSGTTDAEEFLHGEMQMARRTTGIRLSPFAMDMEYEGFMRTLSKYSLTLRPFPMDDRMLKWFYIHSGGNASIITQLFIEGQKEAISSGTESVNIRMMDRIYGELLRGVDPYIRKNTVKRSGKPPAQKNADAPAPDMDAYFNEAMGIFAAASKERDAAEYIARYLNVEAIDENVFSKALPL